MGDGTALRLPTGEELRFLRTGEETAGAVFEVEAVLPPGLSGPPAHWHRVEQEEFVVVDGVLRVRIGSAAHDLEAGQSVVVPPGTVHAFSNPSDRPTRIITRETPAGQLQAQFEVLASAGRVPPLLRLAEVNARHGYTFFLRGLPEGPQRLLWRALRGAARLRGRPHP